MKKALSMLSFAFVFSMLAMPGDTQSTAAAHGELPVKIDIDAGAVHGELTPIWRFFGYDEANYTYMKDGRKLLAELGKLGGPQVYIRCHHLLTSGDGTYALKWSSSSAYKEDAQGRPVYDWTINDRIFDTYLERGLKPYVQIGFMPKDLSTRPELYPTTFDPDKMAPADGGQAYPPKDWAKWSELVFQWTKHCVDKYGKTEVEKWYWEVWNEPNILYWKGTREEYFRLYDVSVDAVRRALPTARVGGPETAGGPGGTFLQDFLTHCARGTNYATGRIGSPLDFISFHAKGSPRFENGHVTMGVSSQLHNIDDAFGVVASFPEYKNTPLIIGESDPEGCAACRGPQNGYRNGTMYSSYTAASFARKFELAEKHGVNFEGALTWAFEFEDKPYFAGFRALATNGIDLPVLNVFRMFGKMSGKRASVQSSSSVPLDAMVRDGVRRAPDVNALAGIDKNRLSVMVWNYHDEDVAGPTAAIDLNIAGLPAGKHTARMTQYRVDADHSDSYSAWKNMGSPAHPSAEQARALEKSGKLQQMRAESLPFADGKATVHFKLPRQGVSLLVFEWK